MILKRQFRSEDFRWLRTSILYVHYDTYTGDLGSAAK